MADALSKVVEVIIKAVDQTGVAVKSVTENLGKVAKQSDKTADSQDKLKKSTDTSASALKKQGAASQQSSTLFDKFKQKLDKTRKSLAKISTSLKKVQKDLKKTGTTASGAGAGVGELISKLTTAAATIGAVAFPIAKAAKFERAMSVVGAVSGATGQDLKDLTAKAREMGEKTEFSASQAAEGLKYLAMAGLDVKQQLVALEPALNLALAGNLDLGRAADIATNIMTGFGATVKELPGMMDVLTQAFTSSNTTLEELGYGMSYVAPVAAGMGVKFNDLVSAMSALANAGMKGSMAGTSLRGMLVKLFSPTSKAVGIMQSLAERIGQTNINLRDSEGGFIGFVGLLEQFEAANVSATDAMTIFGLRAGPAFIALLNQGSSEMKRFNQLMEEATGRTDEIAKVMGNNLVGAGKQLISALEEIATNLGTIFLKDLKEATLKLRDFILYLSDLVTVNQSVIKSIGKVLVVFGLLTAAAGALKVFKIIGTVALKPFIALIKLLGSKVLMLGAVIATIAATWGEFIYEMVKANGDFAKSVDNWDFAKWLNNLTVPLITGKKTIGEFVTYAIAFWDKLISKIKYGFAELPLNFKSLFADTLILFGDFAQNVVDTITAIPGLGKLLGWAVDSTGIQSAIDNIRTKAKQMNQEVAEGYVKAEQAYQSNIAYANGVQAAIEKSIAVRQKETDLLDFIAKREATVAEIRSAAQIEIREATKGLREEIDKQSKSLKTLYEQVGNADEQYTRFVTQAETALKGLGEATKKALSSIWENITNDAVVADFASQLQDMAREYERYSDQNVAQARSTAQAMSEASIVALKKGIAQSVRLIEEQGIRQLVLLEKQKEKEIDIAKATIKEDEILQARLAQIEKKAASEIIAVNEETLNQKKALFEKATTALKAELDKSLSAEKSIADEIIAVQDKIRQSKMTTEELIRELRRKGMSEESAYADEIAEVDEKIAAATVLMATDTKEAIQLLQEAQRQASGLVGEISKGDQVLISEQATINQAIAQVQKAQSAIESGAKSYETSLKSQFAAQKKNTTGLIKQLDVVQEKFGETREQMQQGVEVTLDVNIGDFENRLIDITKQHTVVVKLETEFAEGKRKLKLLQKELVTVTEDVKIKYDVKVADALRKLDEVEKKKLGITEITDVIEIDANGKAAIVALEVVYASGEKVKRLLETPMPISADTAEAITQLNAFKKTITPILAEISRQEELGFDVSEARNAVKEFGKDVTGLKTKLDELGVISLSSMVTGVAAEVIEVSVPVQELIKNIDHLIDASGEAIFIDIVSAGDEDLQAIAQKVKQLQIDTGKEFSIKFTDVGGYEQIEGVRERTEKLYEAVAALNEQETPDVEVEGEEALEQVAVDANTAAEKIGALSEASAEVEDVDLKITVDGIETAQQEVTELVDSIDEANPTLTVDDSGVEEAKEEIEALDDIETVSDHTIVPEAGDVLSVISKIQKPTSSTHTIYVKKVVKNAVGGFVEGIEGYAKGGPVGEVFKRLSQSYIPGNGTKDNVPAMLMQGEYVVRKDAVKEYGFNFLEQINKMQLPTMVHGFAKGGLAGLSAPLTLMPTVASGAISRLKRKIDMDVVPTEVIYREGAPAFNSLINNNLQNIVTPVGKNIAQGIVNNFTGGIQKLQTGGYLSDFRALYNQQRQAITKQYNAQIDLAELTGDEQIVYLLQTEKEELQRLVDELAAVLIQLQTDYDIALREAEAIFINEKTEIDDSLTDLSLDIDKQKFKLDTEYRERTNELKAEADDLQTQINANEIKQEPNVFSWPGHRPHVFDRTTDQQEAYDALIHDKAELGKVEKEFRAVGRDYDTDSEFLEREREEATKQGERNIGQAEQQKEFTDEKAFKVYDNESDVAENTVGHEQKKLQIETKHGVAVTKLDTAAQIIELEGSLRKEIFDLERALLEEERAEAERRAGAETGGIKHFLASGGAIMPRRSKLIPGNGNKDDVPAMLMRGEYVVNKQAVKKFGVGFFDLLNAGMLNMERFATGGVAGFKRKMELAVNPIAPYRNNEGVTMHVNNPTFIEQVKNTVASLSPTGQEHSVNLLGSFNRGSVSLEEGGSVSQATKDLTIEKTLVIAEYDAKIKQAKDVGAIEIAILLEEEKYELAQLAIDLEFVLRQLQDEYNYLKAQIILQQEEEKANIQADFDATVDSLRAQRAQAVNVYEMAKTEAKRRKAEAHVIATSAEIGEGREALDAGIAAYKDGQAQERLAGINYSNTISGLAVNKKTVATRYKKSLSYADQSAKNETKKATADFGRETDFTNKQNEADIEETKGIAVLEVAKTTAILEGEIAGLQASLARELFDLEKSYRTEVASMAGVRHFLKKGGSVGFPAGAQQGVDSISAMLAPGEYVINSKAVKLFGTNFMEAINQFKSPALRFAEGGIVPSSGTLQSLATGSGLKGLNPEYAAKIILNLGGKEFAMRTKTDVGKDLVKEFRTLGLAVAR